MKLSLRVFAAVLAAVLAVVPVLLDGCLLTCQGLPTGQGRAHGSVEQSCHHASHSGPLQRWQDDAKSCGHDHSQTASLTTAASTAGGPVKSGHSATAFVVVVSASAEGGRTLGSRSPPPTPGLQFASRFILPLRI